MMELLVVLLLAQTTVTLAASREYHFVNQEATWAEAQSYCRDSFADLATIETEEDMARVADMVANSGSDYAWIGLYDDVDSWRWSLDNTSLYAGGSTGFGNWAEFKADNKNDNERCIIENKSKLEDKGCEALHTSVCFDELSNTYIGVSDEKNWTSAQSYCRKMYTDLASIRNELELESIQSLGLDKYWIGLSREGWKWSDQSSSLFRRWGGSDPDHGSENCGCASRDGLHDALCQTQIPFICSITNKQDLTFVNSLTKVTSAYLTAPVRRMVKMVVKSKGNLDLNDPKIQEAILKQVEMNFRMGGIQQNIRLTWKKQPTGKVFNLTIEP